MAPSQFRRHIASLSTSLPNLGALRQAKYEFVQKKRLDNDPVIAIWKMKSEARMEGVIQQIGLDSIFIYVPRTNTQLHVYNAFCSMEYAKVCIDGTGSVVKKITSYMT